MKNSRFNGLGSAFAAVSLSFVSSLAFAQGGASGLVYVPGPFECAQACTSDLMCASWNFTPMHGGKAQAMGQCKLSNSPNSAQTPGTISGLPQRQTPQSQIYYSNQIVPSAAPQALNNPSNQIPDWKPVAPMNNAAAINNNVSAYSGNYAIKPLNAPIMGAPMKAPVYQAAPMPAPVMNAPTPPVAPAVVYAPKAPAGQPMVQVAKPAPAPAPVAQYQQQYSVMPPQYQMAQPQPQYQMAQPQALKPPVMAQTPPPQPPQSAPITSNGPLRAGGFKAPEVKAEANNNAVVYNAVTPQYAPSQSYQNYKTTGSPQYSVQSEWNNVADAVANGKNTTNIDWSKTKPVMTSEQDVKADAPQKKSWFQSIFNKKEAAPIEPQTNGGFGPLRKN